MWYKYRGQVRPHKMEKDKPQNSPREIIDHINELRMPCREIDLGKFNGQAESQTEERCDPIDVLSPESSRFEQESRAEETERHESEDIDGNILEIIKTPFKIEPRRN
jgi:hypothetical protein